MDMMHAHNDLPSMMQENRNLAPIVTLSMLQCQMCSQRFSMSGKLSDHGTPVLCVNPSHSIEGPYCIACAGKRDGLRSFQIDDARVALVKLWHQHMSMEAVIHQYQQQQQQQQHMVLDTATACLAQPMSAAAADITRRMAAKQDAPGLMITGRNRRTSFDNGMAGSTEDTTMGTPSQEEQTQSNNMYSGIMGGMNPTPSAAASIASHTNANTDQKNNHKRQKVSSGGYGKTTWTDEEDAILTEAVTNSSEQPFTRWSDLAHQLPGRVGKQIRDRWLNHLDPKIDRSPFTKEEDFKLYQAYKKHGKRWVEISTKYFDSRRSENHVKNRWYSAAFKKFVRQEFGVDPIVEVVSCPSNETAAHSKKPEEPPTSTSSDDSILVEEKKEDAE